MPSSTLSTFSLPRALLPASQASDWRPGLDRSSAALLVLALHAFAILGLMRFGWQAVRPVAPTPVSISLLTEASPNPQAASPTASAKVLQPNVPTATLPVPEVAMLNSASPEAISLPVQPALQVPSPAPIAATAATSDPSPRAAPAQPKPINASSLRYRVEPAVEVPRLSRRAGEQGRVQLRVVFDAEGRPRDVQVLRGSGFARLDAQALEAMQAARISPYLEDGRAIEVMAVATLEYQLD